MDNYAKFTERRGKLYEGKETRKFRDSGKYI